MTVKDGSFPREIKQGFVFPSIDGRLMGFHFGMGQPKEIAKRGTADSRVTGSAFHNGRLYDANSNGVLFDTLENRIVFVAPEGHAIHAVESIGPAEGADHHSLYVLLGIPASEHHRNLALIQLLEDGKRFHPSSVIEARGTVEEAKSDAISMQFDHFGWALSGFLVYRSEEGHLKQASSWCYDHHLLVREAGMPFRASLLGFGQGGLVRHSFPNTTVHPSSSTESFPLDSYQSNHVSRYGPSLRFAARVDDALLVGVPEVEGIHYTGGDLLLKISINDRRPGVPVTFDKPEILPAPSFTFQQGNNPSCVVPRAYLDEVFRR